MISCMDEVNDWQTADGTEARSAQDKCIHSPMAMNVSKVHCNREEWKHAHERFEMKYFVKVFF